MIRPTCRAAVDANVDDDTSDRDDAVLLGVYQPEQHAQCRAGTWCDCQHRPILGNRDEPR